MTCGSDKMVRLWNPRSGVMLKSYSGHGYEVLDCKASCDNANMCSCGMDKTVIYWDVASGNVLRKYRGHAGIINTRKQSCGKVMFSQASVCSRHGIGHMVSYPSIPREGSCRVTFIVINPRDPPCY